MAIFDELQLQYNRERQNAAQYSTYAASLEAANWPGFAAWMRKSAQDEQAHAEKFAGYLIDRNQTPRLDALDAPAPLDGNFPVPMFDAALQLERGNTARILAIRELAEAEADGQTSVFLIWAIQEQTGSEREIVDRLLELRRAEGNAAAMLLLDREAGK